ncbi:MAG: hypothetical protein AAF573_08035 [Bacteroidota bacterium]
MINPSKNSFVVFHIFFMVIVSFRSFGQFSCSEEIEYKNNSLILTQVHYGDFPSTDVTAQLYFGPNSSKNGTYVTTIPNNGDGKFGPVTFAGFDGTSVYPLDVSVSFENGATYCTYENGSLCQNCESPSNPSDYNDIVESCEDITSDCLESFNLFLQENIEEALCNQWVGCKTTGNIYRYGKVSIGTSQSHIFANLTVTEGIITESAKIEFCGDGGWCDYVFEPDYELLTLEEVEDHINEKGHLHKTPSGEEIEKVGHFELKAVSLNQQEKIEEAFLHLIALKKEADQLQAELIKLRSENERLKKGK